MIREGSERRPGITGIAILMALTYLPALSAAPGRMPADTKLYLYLDPGRLIADAPFSWDTRQFAGWVPHQTIAYLWPSGPWFWTFDQLGVPDWIAHRLWIGTLLFLGGLGVRWAARHLGLTTIAASVAGIVYASSPYILPYVSRTSVMLLPWAGVGWVVALTIRATSRTRWRDAALAALVVLTVGAVNATALALIAPAPVIWLLHAAWGRSISWRIAAITALKVGALSLLVSLWWMVMLVVQGRHGADVLAFSETLEAVSLTAVSTEVLRSLGYWLFYVRDPYAFTTTASIHYMTSVWGILVGYALLCVGLLGIAISRWSQRRYAALLVAMGVVLAVGVHPIDDPSPLMGPLADSALGLALRSSTRALPLAAFGIALGAGALVSVLASTSSLPRSSTSPSRRLALIGLPVVLLAVLNLPALWSGGFVDPALERDQDVPAAWIEASNVLSASSTERRVLQVPGSEFGAFRWGYTVDPPLPGLTTKPLVTRDLLPLGSPGAMDVLYALDNRFQAGTVEPDSVAPVARLLGVDTIWVSNDLAFDRFRTPRPEIIADLFDRGAEGLGTAVPYGEPTPNVPDIGMVDEQQLSDPRLGTPLPAVSLVPVDDPTSIIRTATRTVVLAGSGDGLVDAAAAGLIAGDEAIVYAADLPAFAAAGVSLPAGTPLIVTDSNRDRAYQWRTSQDVSGFTEVGGAGSDVTRPTDADQRLAVFDSDDDAQQTVARLVGIDGEVRVAASAYGEPFAYRPEDRPAMAVDGDPTTAWRVADRADPIGESITVSTTDGELRLVQQQLTTANRTISRVTIRAGDESPVVVDLGADSLGPHGQSVAVSPDVAVTIEITGVAPRPEGTDTGPSAVGFAEIGPVAHEYVRPPVTALAALSPDDPFAIVLTRERVRDTDRWRSDPESSLVRRFTLPSDRAVDTTVTLRMDARADDPLIDALAGDETVAVGDARLTGVPSARGAAAVDGDPSTGWTTPFGQALGSSIAVTVDAGSTIDGLVLTQPVDELHSTITRLVIRTGDDEQTVEVPAPDGDGRSTLAMSPIQGSHVTLTIDAVDARTTIDRRFAEVVTLPASIVEIGGLTLAPPAVATVPTCHTGLLALDGRPVGVSFGQDVARRLAAGKVVDVSLCEDERNGMLSVGPHEIVSVAGALTGVDVDRVTIRSGVSATRATPVPAPRVDVERTRSTRTATVAPCPDGCWMVLGEGHNDAWTANDVSPVAADGGELGPPMQVSGGFNGWWLPPSDRARVIEMRWTPQASLNIALLLALVGVLVCIVVAALDRRVLVASDPQDAGEQPRLAPLGERSSRRDAWFATGVLVAGSALVVSPLWAAVALVPAAVVVGRRVPRLLALSAVAAAGALGVLVASRQWRERYMPNAAWPGFFEDLHLVGVFVVVLLAAGCLHDDRTR